MPNALGVPDRAMFFWGPIQEVANAHGTVTQMWDTIRAVVQSMGWQSPGVGATDISRLWTAAVRVRESAAQFNAATPTESMAASFLADAPWARPVQIQNLSEKYLVRFTHETADDNGVVTSDIKSAYINGPLPPTVGDLLDVIDEDAEEMADKYGRTHVGASVLEILRV